MDPPVDGMGMLLPELIFVTTVFDLFFFEGLFMVVIIIIVGMEFIVVVVVVMLFCFGCFLLLWPIIFPSNPVPPFFVFLGDADDDTIIGLVVVVIFPLPPTIFEDRFVS